MVHLSVKLVDFLEQAAKQTKDYNVIKLLMLIVSVVLIKK